MAYAMTKRGSLDNCVTYEFICDTVADMNAIEDRYRTIGSTAVVLQGDAGLEVYISGSDKTWTSLSVINSSGGSVPSGGGLSFHICGQDELDANGLPDVSEPDEVTFYLVPAADETTGNIYDEYIYVDDEWERFGSGGTTTIDLSAYAPKANPAFTGSVSLDRYTGSTVGELSVSLGRQTKATGNYSFAEGNYTIASGSGSHAEGQSSVASGYNSHAEGLQTKARGNYSHAEGQRTTGTDTTTYDNTTYYYGASGESSHSEGKDTIAHGDYSHAEGASTIASGSTSHAEGATTKASGNMSHAEGARTTASSFASHSEGSNTTASGAISHAEGVNAVASGEQAHAEGSDTKALGISSHAEGGYSVASGMYSHAEGASTFTSGAVSHAEGAGTTAINMYSHSEGNYTIASGLASHSEGEKTGAIGAYEHVSGRYNVLDSAPVWVASTSYNVGDLVSKDVTYTNQNNQQATYTCIYKCKTANSDSTFTLSKWEISGVYAEIIGNGTATNARSNARALDWSGNEHLMGDLYVGCNADSTGGTKVAKISDVPDVQVNGTSIVSNGVANIPMATKSVPGAIILGSGLYTEDGKTHVDQASPSQIKAGASQSAMIATARQHTAVFYGLAKAAGQDMAQSENAVGTYTAEAKAAIKSMIGVNVDDVQMNGTSIVSNGVANIPVATQSGDYGVVKINASLGVGITEDMLYIAGATNDMVKGGINSYKPIVPSRQHMSVFYGLAKVAGYDDEKYSELALGTYSADAKSAISDMLNAPETVSGTAVSITAKSGIRYECGEVTTLTITPPASGDCEFIFESGSTATVLTVNPPTGVTAVKWPDWFDAEDLEPDTIYDIIITNGRYGVVTSWT